MKEGDFVLMVDLLAKEKKFKLIWISCLNEPKNIYNIGKDWNYKGIPASLYKEEVLKAALNYGMIKISDTLEHKGKYYSLTNWFFTDKFRKEIPHIVSNVLFQKMFIFLSENKDYKAFLNDKEVRKFFFEINKISGVYNKSNKIIKKNDVLGIVFTSPLYFGFFVAVDKVKKQTKKDDMVKALLEALPIQMAGDNPELNRYEYYKELAESPEAEKIVKKMPKGIMNDFFKAAGMDMLLQYVDLDKILFSFSTSFTP